MTYCRCYQIGGLTIQVESELPITETTFGAKFELFEVDGPGEPGERVVIRHIFRPFDFEHEDLGERVYRKAPWAIYRRGDEWLYLSVSPTMEDSEAGDVAVLSDDHTLGHMYHAREDVYREGDLHSLSMFTTDQVLLDRVLADRQGCYLHSAGAILDGQGLLFVAHSGTGKSTLTQMLQDYPHPTLPLPGGGDRKGVEVLCDDRNIVRRQPGGFWAYGTWSHGEWPVVSASSAPLRAILFLEQAPENRLLPLDGGRDVISRLVACLITPYAPADWWRKSLDVVERLAREVPCYRLRFDKSGGVVDVLRQAFGQGRDE
jgi:hypothetical protein